MKIIRKPSSRRQREGHREAVGRGPWRALALALCALPAAVLDASRAIAQIFAPSPAPAPPPPPPPQIIYQTFPSGVVPPPGYIIGPAGALVPAPAPTPAGTPYNGPPLPTPAPIEPEPLPATLTRLSNVADYSARKRNLPGMDEAAQFTRRGAARFLEAVEICAERNAWISPLQTDFHLYVLDDKFRVLADVPVPSETIPPGPMAWHTLRTPPIEVTEKFYVAVDFAALNPGQNPSGLGPVSAIDLGVDPAASGHSFIGSPAAGFAPFLESADWMMRALLSERPSDAARARHLADWKPPSPGADPFAGCLEVAPAFAEPYWEHASPGPLSVVRYRVGEMLPPGMTLERLRLAGVRIMAGAGAIPQNLPVGFFDRKIEMQILTAQGIPFYRWTFPADAIKPDRDWITLAPAQPIDIRPWVIRGSESFSTRLEQSMGLESPAWKEPDSQLILGVGQVPGPRVGPLIAFYTSDAGSTTHSQVLAGGSGFSDLSGHREWLIKLYFKKVDAAGR